MSKKKSSSGDRPLAVNVRSAKGRKISSTLWLQRQLNDPYVQRAKVEGYRSRAAYKLAEINERYKFLKPGMRVLDLGAAPGGWTQVAVEEVKPSPGTSNTVIGIDLLPIEDINGATLIQMDFLADDAEDKLREMLGGEGVDIVLSDMAPNTTGHRQTDHLRIVALCEAAAYFSFEILNENGAFLAKVLQGGTINDLLAVIKQRFRVVKHVKPKASRADSAEMYLLATGFKK